MSELLRNGANVDAAALDQFTPLHFAVQNGHIGVMVELLAHQANMEAEDGDGCTPLLRATQSGRRDVVVELLGRGANLEAVTKSGWTPLHTAAWHDQSGVTNELLARGANVEAVTGVRETSLHIAAGCGHGSVVVELLTRGANLEAVNENLWTPLHAAAWCGHSDVVNELLAHGANVEATNQNGQTPIYLAAGCGHNDVVVKLLRKGANVDAAIMNQMTPLHTVAAAGHKDVVVELLMHQANVGAEDVHRTTSLLHAARNGHKDVVVALLAHKATVDATNIDRAPPLLIASANGHTDVVVELLAHQANVKGANIHGLTTLHYASLFGRVDVVDELLLRRADVDAGEHNGKTSLHYASEHGHKNVVIALLKHRTNVDTADMRGATALRFAAENGHNDVVAALLVQRANANAAGLDGETPLHLAAGKGHCDVVIELMANRANAGAKDKERRTPLYVATRNGHTAVVIELLAYRTGVDAADTKGMTPLCIAAERGHSGIVAALISHQANVIASDQSGRTPLHIAAQHGCEEITAKLLTFHANANAADHSGQTPLHIAAQFGQIEVVTLLAERLASPSNEAPCIETIYAASYCCADLNAADMRGNTPVLAAARSGHFDVVKHLISVGASVHARADDGETVLMSAARQRSVSAVSMLFDLGYLAPRPTNNGTECLFSATLQTLSVFKQQTHEFDLMWTRLVGRLVSTYALLVDSPDSRRDSVFQFAMIVFHCIRLKSACYSSTMFARLVASQTIANRFRDFHTELTFLECGLRSEAPLHFDLEAQCESDEQALLELFREKISSESRSVTVANQGGLFQAGFAFIREKFSVKLRKRPTKEIFESATLLQHTVRARSGTCSKELLNLLKLSLHNVRTEYGEMDLVVLHWFIPVHELDVAQIAEEDEDTAQSRGKWSNSAVTVVHHYRGESALFIEAVKRCCKLNHPNVVQIFGASHLGPPFLAVFEDASSTNLREYLALEENKHLLWQKLLEVARGLQYLIESEILVETLRCSEIWVTKDRIAKINALNCVVSRDVTQKVRWHAPEKLTRGDASTIASNVYSLGMCALEALTGELPWGSDTLVAVAIKVPAVHRPQLPDDISSAQRSLLSEMWQPDPSKRLTLSSVVHRLKQFADEQELKFKSQGRIINLQQQSFDIKRFIFPEFESTITGFLTTLEWKCRNCQEQKGAVLYILRRARDVYRVIESQYRISGDQAVEDFCEVLQSLAKFLRNAFHDKSLLLRAKSQKVALKSNVFHRQLDELLELLAPLNIDPIHN